MDELLCICWTLWVLGNRVLLAWFSIVLFIAKCVILNVGRILIFFPLALFLQCSLCSVKQYLSAKPPCKTMVKLCNVKTLEPWKKHLMLLKLWTWKFSFAKVSFAFLFFASHVTAFLHSATRNYQRMMYDQIAFCLFDMSLAPTIYTDLKLNYFESTPCTHWQNVISFFCLYKLLINITYLFLSLWGLYVSFTKNKQLR